MKDLQGWSGIIREVSEKLAPFDVFIVQIKEKWGVLRIIYHFEGTAQDRTHIQQIISEAEEQSAVTCECCGKPAETIKVKGWMKTLCRSCLEKAIST